MGTFFPLHWNTLGNNVISTFDDLIMADSIATYKVSNNHWGYLQFIISSYSITIVPINIFQKPETITIKLAITHSSWFDLLTTQLSKFWNFCYKWNKLSFNEDDPEHQHQLIMCDLLQLSARASSCIPAKTIANIYRSGERWLLNWNYINV